MTDDPHSRASLAAALGVERMHPPEFVAFFGGLPRRVTALALGAQALDAKGDGEASGPHGQPPTGDEAEAEPTVDPTDELVEIADAVDLLAERTGNIGLASDTDTGAAPIDLSVLDQTSPEIAILLRRIEASSVDVSRRIAGLSSSAWNSNPGLIDHVRSAVVETVGPIRAVERRIQRHSDD
ncbi:MAG: hypothetical protein ACR2QE_04460 [Acidimicrobiales bacterium]